MSSSSATLCGGPRFCELERLRRCGRPEEPISTLKYVDSRSIELFPGLFAMFSMAIDMSDTSISGPELDNRTFLIPETKLSSCPSRSAALPLAVEFFPLSSEVLEGRVVVVWPSSEGKVSPFPSIEGNTWSRASFVETSASVRLLEEEVALSAGSNRGLIVELLCGVRVPVELAVATGPETLDVVTRLCIEVRSSCHVRFRDHHVGTYDFRHCLGIEERRRLGFTGRRESQRYEIRPGTSGHKARPERVGDDYYLTRRPVGEWIYASICTSSIPRKPHTSRVGG